MVEAWASDDTAMRADGKVLGSRLWRGVEEKPGLI